MSERSGAGMAFCLRCGSDTEMVYLPFICFAPLHYRDCISRASLLTPRNIYDQSYYFSLCALLIVAPVIPSPRKSNGARTANEKR